MKLSRPNVDDALVGWEGAAGSRIGDELFPSYPLADGRVVRLYHSSIGRNWRAPRREPAEPQPESLDTLQLSTMLPPPPPPQPGKRELPSASAELVSTIPVAPKPSVAVDLGGRRNVTLIVELATREGDDDDTDGGDPNEPPPPPPEEFDFAEEEVAKIEEEVDPFDLL
mmetsp:Transcript_10668/g.27463  ORF Transcript_10668/g.27463 Transcript_10668/m.27463 type:complete len:169 (-) Transcript_10668:110-616(-)